VKAVVNSIQMKTIDSYTIQKIGIPAMVLMERAAMQVCESVRKHVDKNERILAVCGTGNNGADGIAAARILFLEGYLIDILIVGDETSLSEQANQQLAIARNLGLFIDNNIKIDEYIIIIDALFGIGLSRSVTGIHEKTIQHMNSGKHVVFSVDIPSGLSADTGKPLGIAVKADYTITFGLNMLGLILHPGCQYAGEVIVSDIGFPDLSIEQANPNCFIYDKTDVIKKLPKRQEYSNKGTYGKVLIIAGSVNMSGACFLSAKAAYRTGAGLVKVLTVEDNRTILQTLLPEALVSTYQADIPMDKTEMEKILTDISWATVIVIGPGIGISQKSEKILDLVVQNAKVPIIIDADAINILADRNHKSGSNLEEITEKLAENTILTPHLKELSRLINLPVAEITNNLLGVADQCTHGNKIIFTIKDARTIVAYENMRYINTSGNSGMATGGSGDVLTGIIAALVAQGLIPSEAAMLGVYIHGLAGDKAMVKKGQYALIASDIIEELAEVCNK
jgi:NAD(P)H-hydrate epimerase